MPIEPLGPNGSTDEYRRVCTHGDPGSGKTSWARSIVTERTLAIDCGGGIGVLADVLKPEQIIHLAVPADLKTVEQERLAAQLAVNFSRAFEYVKAHVPDWLIVDDITPVAQGLETIGRLDMEAGKAYISDTGKADTFGLYGALGNTQFRLLTKLKALPCNLYVTATSDIEYETEWTTDPKSGREVSRRTGKKWVTPALVGKKILEPWMAAFDAVLYFHTQRVQEGQRVITKYLARTAPTPTIKAKLRSLPSAPVPDVLSLGQRTDDGVVSVRQTDWTLARLTAAMLGTAIAK